MALGFPHPDYLDEALNAKQLRDWEVYYSIEPFGEESAFRRTGVIASTLINLKLKKEAKKLTPNDFMPMLYVGKKEEQTTTDMKDLMSSMSQNKTERKHG